MSDFKQMDFSNFPAPMGPRKEFTSEELRLAIKKAVKILNELIPILEGEQIGDTIGVLKNGEPYLKVKLIADPFNGHQLYRRLSVQFIQFVPTGGEDGYVQKK